MATYTYECQDCFVEATKNCHELTETEYESKVLFETTHAMEPTDDELYDATECPRCGCHNCVKTLYDCNVICYVRGNGYLDREGCHRDMNLCALETEDPYADYRVPGEVDDLKARLKRAGQHDPKTKHYVVSESEMNQAVSEATETSIE